MHLHVMSAMLFEQWLFNRSSKVQQTRQRTIFLTYEEKMAWSDTCCSLLGLWRLINTGTVEKRKGADRFPASQLSCKTLSGSLFDATLLPFPYADTSVSCGTIDELLSSWRYRPFARERLCRFPMFGRKVWSSECLGRCPISPLNSIIRDSSVLRQSDLCFYALVEYDSVSICHVVSWCVEHRVSRRVQLG